MTKDLATRDARARAGRIRDGIHNYLSTLGEIAAAWREGDWRILGYADWDAYVDGEFGAERLRLPDGHRQKAITELRLAGMSQRAIASVVGVSQKTVDRDLGSTESFDSVELPDRVMSLDGRERPAARPSPQDEVAGAMSTHLPPDDPWRSWRASYIGDIHAGYRVISRQTVAEVVERADETCVGELLRLAEEIGRHADEVKRARLTRYGDNVVPMRSAQ